MTEYHLEIYFEVARSENDEDLIHKKVMEDYAKRAFYETFACHDNEIYFNSYGITAPDDRGKRRYAYYFVIPEITHEQAREVRRWLYSNRRILPVDPYLISFHISPPGGLNEHPEYAEYPEAILSM